MPSAGSRRNRHRRRPRSRSWSGPSIGDEWVRRGAVEALGSFGEDAAPAMPKLRTLEQDPTKDVRIAASAAVATIGAASFESPRKKKGHAMHHAMSTTPPNGSRGDVTRWRGCRATLSHLFQRRGGGMSATCRATCQVGVGVGCVSKTHRSSPRGDHARRCVVASSTYPTGFARAWPHGVSCSEDDQRRGRP